MYENCDSLLLLHQHLTGHKIRGVQGELKSVREIVSALKQCRKTGDLEEGKKLHMNAVAANCHRNKYVAAALIGMYMKCGSVDSAKEAFDRTFPRDVVLWNSLILGYVENGESSMAIVLFTSMDCEPDSVTYVAVLKAIIKTESEKQNLLKKGIAIHERLTDGGFNSDTKVSTTLMDMYSKCGSLLRAQEVFNKMIRKDIIAWNCLFLGYVENGESSLVLDLFRNMDCEPDVVTYIALLKACRDLGEIGTGQVSHARVYRVGFEQVEMIMTALLDFYGKFGNMLMAEVLFNSMYSPDVVSWTSLLAGYASVGDSSRVFELTNRLQEAGLQVTDITVLGILTACSRAGLVEEGRMWFSAMPRYGICPSLEHYNSMVDMLGRSNRIYEALSVVNSMPLKPNMVTWKTLLGACGKWKNLEVGKVAFDALVESGTADTNVYILMGDIYTSLSMWKDLEQL